MEGIKKETLEIITLLNEMKLSEKRNLLIEDCSQLVQDITYIENCQLLNWLPAEDIEYSLEGVNSDFKDIKRFLKNYLNNK
jgi:hypothetical protein